MEFQVLGPISVRQGQTPLRLGGPKQQLVLAMMLASRGDPVSLDSIVENAWPEGASPVSSRKSVQVYIHRLRCQLGAVVQTVRDGYALKVASEQVDERVFGTQLAEARPLLESNPTAASEKLSAALDLWHGEPYAGFEEAPALRPEFIRLSESRLAALGDRIDCELKLGRHQSVVGEVASLAMRYPLNERFQAQEMLALYRCGRRADALRAYARYRKQSIEELGLQPSSALAALELQILCSDLALDCHREAFIYPSRRRLHTPSDYGLSDVAFMYDS